MFKSFEFIRFSLIVFIFLYYGTSLDLFLLSHGYVSLAPTKILLAAAGLYLLLVLLEPGKATLNRVAHNAAKAGGPVVLYVLFCLVFVIWGLHPTANTNSGGAYIYLSLYNLFLFVVAFVAFSDMAILSRWRPIVLLPLLLIVISIWVEIKFPLLITDEVFGRKTGIVGNPNAAAFFMVILMLFLVDFKKPKIVDMVFFGLSVMGIFATFSRGGYLLTFLLGFGLVVRVLMEGNARNTLTLLFGCVLIVAFFKMALVEFDVLDQGGASTRLELMLNGEWEELAAGEGASDRKDLFDEHVTLALESPVWGHGTGYTYTGQEAGGPHNVYVQIWCNQGVIGVLITLMMLASLFWYFIKNLDYKGMLFTLILAVEGLLNHNIFDQRPAIIMIGAFLAFTASGSWYLRQQRVSRLSGAR